MQNGSTNQSEFSAKTPPRLGIIIVKSNNRGGYYAREIGFHVVENGGCARMVRSRQEGTTAGGPAHLHRRGMGPGPTRQEGETGKAEEVALWVLGVWVGSVRTGPIPYLQLPVGNWHKNSNKEGCMYWKTRTVCVPPGRGVRGHVGTLGETPIAIVGGADATGTVVEVSESGLHLRQVRVIGELDLDQEVNLAIDGECKFKGQTLELEGA